MAGSRAGVNVAWDQAWQRPAHAGNRASEEHRRSKERGTTGSDRTGKWQAGRGIEQARWDEGRKRKRGTTEVKFTTSAMARSSMVDRMGARAARPHAVALCGGPLLCSIRRLASFASVFFIFLFLRYILSSLSCSRTWAHSRNAVSAVSNEHALRTPYLIRRSAGEFCLTLHSRRHHTLVHRTRRIA